ncbi:hypothetical protein KJ742_04020 [Patescibacteria group bacterium]|nr:hypothetical protein [Patescibacteria group bacterium]MBU1683088.1 hypothetical protein [Patescibacteria group bacterium]MBU1935151.1 hypothetical protein [Patescibacteria group bacterium]
MHTRIILERYVDKIVAEGYTEAFVRPFRERVADIFTEGREAIPDGEVDKIFKECPDLAADFRMRYCLFYDRRACEQLGNT